MILTVDIGNTSVGLCALEGSGGDSPLLFSAKLASDRSRSEAEYRAELEPLLTGRRWRGVVLCSVVPELTGTLRNCIRSLTGLEPLPVTAESDTGLTIAVPEPRKVGPDRLADAAWAAAYLPLPAVTVDMGTAATFNVVDRNAAFLGGLIAPGLDTGLQALSKQASRLPKIMPAVPECLIGRTTEECMLSGAVTGAAAMIDGVVERIEEELGSPVTLILTGGMARYVDPLCRHPHIWDPYLMPRALTLIYERTVEA